MASLCFELSTPPYVAEAYERGPREVEGALSRIGPGLDQALACDRAQPASQPAASPGPKGMPKLDLHHWHPARQLVDRIPINVLRPSRVEGIKWSRSLRLRERSRRGIRKAR
jgi:hypothetical protein